MSEELVEYNPESTLPESRALAASRVAREILSVAKQDKTDPHYIGYKDGYAYVDSKYTDDKFNKYFPVCEQELVNQSVFQDYWLQIIVKLTVTLPNGFKISRLGAGAARIQVSRTAKEAFLQNGTRITPFDYIDYQNTVKSALTMAIKNAQERFGINADATDRIILSAEEIEQVKASINQIIESIGSERDKIRAKEKLNSLRKPSELVKFLNQLQEYYQLT